MRTRQFQAGYITAGQNVKKFQVLVFISAASLACSYSDLPAGFTPLFITSASSRLLSALRGLPNHL